MKALSGAISPAMLQGGARPNSPPATNTTGLNAPTYLNEAANTGG